jgi:hypothetical protein
MKCRHGLDKSLSEHCSFWRGIWWVRAAGVRYAPYKQLSEPATAQEKKRAGQQVIKSLQAC